MAAGLAVSCAAEDSERPVLGLAEQGIYADVGYGQNHANGYRCTLPLGSGQRCDAPDTKTLPIFLDTDNCPVWMIPWMRDTINWFALYMNTDVGDWNAYLAGEGQETTSTWHNLGITVVGCNTSKSSIVPAQTTMHYEESDCNAAGSGQWCQWTHGHNVNMFAWTTTHATGWLSATDAQKEFLTNNVLRHELFHVAGLGHNACLNCFSQLMHVGVNLTNNTNVWWNQEVWPSTFEQDWLHRYNPTSATDPH